MRRAEPGSGRSVCRQVLAGRVVRLVDQRLGGLAAASLITLVTAGGRRGHFSLEEGGGKEQIYTLLPQ